MRFAFVALLLAGLSCWCQPEASASDRPALEGLAYERLEEGAEVVHFNLNGPHIPKIFMLTGEKPRLVIDFPDTGYGGQSRFTPEKSGLVKRIRIGIHEKPQMKTRVVIDLSPDRQVSWEQDFLVHSNRLDITILPAGGAIAVEQDEPMDRASPPLGGQERISAGELADETPQQPVVQKPEPDQGIELAAKTPAEMEHAAPQEDAAVPLSGSDVPVLLDVTFESNPEKGEMVLFKLDDFHPPVVSAIEKGTPRVVCDFYNMKIAGKIKETLTVGGKYIRQVRVARHENPGKVRAVLDLVPGRDYGLQQVFFNEDNLFVLMVNLLAGAGNGQKSQ